MHLLLKCGSLGASHEDPPISCRLATSARAIDSGKIQSASKPRMAGRGRSPGVQSWRAPGPGSGQEHIRLDCTVNELVCIVYRVIIDLRFAVGGHTIIIAYVRFNQHTYDEQSSALAQLTPEVVCVRGQMKLRPSWLR